MKQILWFRRDLRITDNAILAHAKGEILPIFIFDMQILSTLSKEDKRVTFIYQSVLKLKKELQSIGLDLAIFYGDPKTIFTRLKSEGFQSVLCSVDYEQYAKERDEHIAQIIPLYRFTDSYLIDPKELLNQSNAPYKVFTPFYNALSYLWESKAIGEFSPASNLALIPFDYSSVPTLENIGFEKQELPHFLNQSAQEVLQSFIPKLNHYNDDRDYFYLTGSSQLSVYLRFGRISPKEIFNTVRPYAHSQAFIRQLFFRDFYNYLLYHFPYSQFENYKNIKVEWSNNQEHFQKWCKGQTGVPIIDAGMQYFNQTGMMHNRLRMIVASYLTKNLLIDWRWGERYFAQHLLDYDASANIASWQWAGSTGCDGVPYFRVFNPYLQSAKFDKEAHFIKSVLPQLKDLDAKLIHKENGVQSNLWVAYPQQLVSIEDSRKRAIERFKKAQHETL